jgi:methylthioribose-1-phosphate isomerase
MEYIPSIKFENENLFILDQTIIPEKVVYIKLVSIKSVYDAIKKLKVRGAPAIGIVAAYALYLTALEIRDLTGPEFRNEFNQRAEYLSGCRPTAVNLNWATARMKRIVNNNRSGDMDSLITDLLNEALTIHEEDRKACHQIGMNGAALISDSCEILTHCNTGSLATGGWGTALGVVYAAKKLGRKIHVFVDETRPLGQGARLTLWELMTNNIPCTLITDSAAGSLLSQQKIDIVIFGADRIARNGDVANKIGSYSLAALANLNHIPCYAAAPLSTFDFSIQTGSDIEIELRDPQEILQFYNYDRSLAKNADVYNPAFDVTPAHFLTGIITEVGILGQPLDESIHKNASYFLKEQQ